MPVSTFALDKTTMKRTAYSILGVSESATEAGIERAYQMRLVEIQTNMKLADADKHQEIAAIDEANRILSRSTSRTIYDRKLAQENADVGDQTTTDNGSLRNKIIAVVVALAIAAGGFYWMQQREAERVLVNEERIAAELKAAKATVDAEKARLKFEEQQRNDAAERKASEEARLEQARLQREQDMQAEKFVALPQAAPQKSAAEINRDNFKREINQIIQQREGDRQQRQAQQEVDRQKRYLQQLEDEERLAAQRRANSANPDPRSPR